MRGVRRFIAVWCVCVLAGGVLAALTRSPDPGEPFITSSGPIVDDLSTTTSTIATTTSTTVGSTTTVVSAPSSTTVPVVVDPPATSPTTSAKNDPAPTARHAAGNGLYVVTADGSALRLITPRCLRGDVAWANHGQSLVVADRAAHRIDVYDLDGQHRWFTIPFSGWAASPTAERLVLSRGPFAQETTSVFDFSGHKLVDLEDEGSITPSFSPDGTRVLLYRADQYGQYEVLRPDGSTIRPWTHTTFSLWPQFASVWSPDGTKVLGMVGQADGVLDLDTGQAITLPDAFSPGDLAWVDDQTILGTGARPEGTPMHVARYDLRTRTTSVFANGIGGVAAQHRGQAVAARSFSPAGTVAIYDRHGAKQATIVDLPENHAPWLYDWSPDEHWLAFSACDNGQPNNTPA